MNHPRIRRRTDLRPVLVAIIAVVGLCVPLGALAAGRIGTIEASYSLGRLEAEELALERENEKLTLEVSTLRSPARLLKLAHDRFHMAAPGTGDLLLEGGASPLMPLAHAMAARK